tara:strand:+ start:44599 stop:45021 length:423 start_codon:yes stop_codon:yes gene_type:complete
MSSFERTLKDGQGGFAGFLEAIESYLDEQCVPSATVAQLMIVFDEVISNVFSHGADGRKPAVHVKIDVREDSVSVEIADDGTAFDPLSQPDPATDLPVEDRPLGGLGLHIVRKLMDDIVYSRKDGWNRLRFFKVFPLEAT